MDAVLFDLDETLCAYRRPSGEVLRAAFDRVGVPELFPVTEYFERFEEFGAETATIDDLRRECFATLAAERGHSRETGRRVAEAYDDERDPSDVVALPGASAAVERLAGDHRLGIVTNSPADTVGPKLDALPFADAFDIVVAVDETTPPKPAVEPFHSALDALGVAPGRTVHVGNSLHADVAGANAVGLTSVYVPHEGYHEEATVDDHPPDHRVASLADLPAVV